MLGFYKYMSQFVRAYACEKQKRIILHSFRTFQATREKSWPWQGCFFLLVRGPLAGGRAWAQKRFYFVIMTARTSRETRVVFDSWEKKTHQFIFLFFI